MKKIISLILTISLLACALCACNTSNTSDETATVRIGALTGPTAMGLVKLMDDNNYEFTLQSEASAFAALIAKGELDIAAVPANLASVIYNNTNGGVVLLAVNTLGVLYIVERGNSINSFTDLAGKTLYATGEGAAPEYALRYLLKANGIDGENAPTIKWCTDTTEALSYIAADEDAIAMLPQPFITAAQQKVEGLNIALDLNEEWGKVSDGADMITGVVVANRAFAENHPDQLEAFMNEYASSVEFVLNNTEQAAELIGEHEIVAAPIALKALPYCNITFIKGQEMKDNLQSYLNVLYNFNPSSIGGALPAEDFYYGV